jgi:PAS domain S-box-containing protein
MNDSTPIAVRVLLVDDDYDDYELTRQILRELRGGLRCDLEWVRTYEDAREALATRAPDVCLLDYYLGPHTGIELLVDSSAVEIGVPIILLTGRGSAGVEKQALAAGAADYLVKGEIDAKTLERSIRHSLERARSIEALRHRERQFRAVFESTLDAMLIANDQGYYVDANQAALSLLGVDRDELPKMHVTDLAAPEEREAMAVVWQRILTEGRTEGEFQFGRADGTLRIVECRATAAITPGCHLLALRDVTAKRSADAQRLRLANMVESAADAIIGITLDATIDYWSPGAMRLFGYAAEEVIGRPKRILIPEDRARELNDTLAFIRRGEAREYETVRLKKDGTTFDASVTLSPVRQDGHIVAASVITRDISERKRLEAHLAVSDRMASVGTLAAGVAHEINNPLAAVIANLDLVGEMFDGPALDTSYAAEAVAPAPPPLADVRELVTEARTAADRIRHVVKDLKLFSRADEERRGPVDVRRTMESALRMAGTETRHRARVVQEYGDVSAVEGNEARLGQVFVNLVVNAAQAIPEGDVERNAIRVVTRMEGADRVVVEVSDTGAGMPPEVLDRLFEPFFTTKPVGIGTGLGLSICRRIVHEHGGSIGVESALGRGTTFRVVLPAARNGRSPSFPPISAPSVGTRGGRVLIIDDEVVIGKVVQRALEPLHEVTVTTSASEALEWLRAGAEYDVILCDIMMPQMTGIAFHEELTKFRPKDAERIIFLTGGAFTATAREFLDRVPNQRIDKPFDATHLRNIVASRVSKVTAPSPSSLPSF